MTIALVCLVEGSFPSPVVRVVVWVLVSVGNTLAHTRMNPRGCSTSKLTIREALGTSDQEIAKLPGAPLRVQFILSFIHLLPIIQIKQADLGLSLRTGLSVALELEGNPK